MTDEVEPHIFEKYTLLEKLGMGAYGVVWKAIKKKSQKVVALKKVFDAFHNKTDAQRTYREVMILQGLKGHPNITQLESIIRAKNNKDLYMVFEFKDADLHAAIKSKILKSLHHKYITYQILKAMKYIHSAEIVHRDLKPSNVLISPQCKIQIADFGLARSIVKENDLDDDPILTEYIATRWYRAPEIVLGSQQYSKAVDIWSIGCILGEMIHGEAIFPGRSTLNQVELILRLIGLPSDEEIDSLECHTSHFIIKSLNLKKFRDWTRFFPGASEDALDFIRLCLKFNPEERPDVDQLLRHDYVKEFRGTENDRLIRKAINLGIDDNLKLGIKDYRNALYKNIAKNRKLGLIKSFKKSQMQFNQLNNKLGKRRRKMKPSSKES